jgi:hypothetical protein
MRSSMLVGVLLLAFPLFSCSKKTTECELVVQQMKGLAQKLSTAQKVTSNKAARLAQVVAALRPFAESAKSTGEMLTKTEFSNPELKKIAEDASEAALALAESASKMADAAERMKGLDAARQAVNIRKTFVDAGEQKIRDLCAKETAQCAALSRVLFAAPAFPESAGDLNAKQQWAGQVNVWLSQLSSIPLSNSELKQRTTSLIQAWTAFVSAMTALAALSDAALEMDAAAKSLSSNIGAANSATSAAVSFCKR